MITMRTLMDGLNETGRGVAVLVTPAHTDREVAEAMFVSLNTHADPHLADHPRTRRKIAYRTNGTSTPIKYHDRREA